MTFIFLLCLSCSALLPAISPIFHLSFFSPLIALAYRQCPKWQAIAWTLAAGIAQDILSYSSSFGFYTLLFSFCGILAPLWNRTVLKSETFSLLLATYLFVLTETISKMVIAWQFSIADLLFMPLLDLAYASAVLISTVNKPQRKILHQ